ncbi:MAG: hypothetical protein NTW21_17565 [Verrucomicrobia bacterium]|nr:hypothetical protein [Verrucomicrobiota bacterium]
MKPFSPVLLLLGILFVPPPCPAEPARMPIKGMSLATYEPRGFYNAQASLDRLLYDQFNWVALNVFIYQDTISSVTIYQHPRKTADDQSIREVVARAHDRGLRVFLKVNVDSLDEGWRSLFNPTDPAAWFASYGSNLVHYAQLAAETGAELFSVGTEFVSLAQTNNLARWQGIISQVRAVYSGRLVYCANWDEASAVPFWPLLDCIGIDAYYPLHGSNTVTAAQIAAAWTHSQSTNPSFTGRNWYAEIDALRRSQGKNVIFTEIGYPSADGGAEEPWRYDLPTYNADLQKACHEGTVAFWDGVDWLEGLFVWKWDPKLAPTGPGDTGYFVYGKPAETALRELFGGRVIPLPPGVVTPLQPYLVRTPDPRPVLSWYVPEPPRYEFFGWEDHEAMGWYSDDDPGNQGFGLPPLPQAVPGGAYGGAKSLKCHLNLVDGDGAYNQGMLWVDLSQPVNLTNRVVFVALWIPSALINGTYPNGVQLAFKDVRWKYCDTGWANITSGNQWMTFSATLPQDINWNDGIDLSRVAHVGFKIGAGSGSGTNFDGDIYVDDYDLRASPPTLYQVQVARDAAFSSPDVDVAGLDNIYLQPQSPMTPGIRYWRVRMDSGAGYGPWSETTGFAVSNPDALRVHPSGLFSGAMHLQFANMIPGMRYEVQVSPDLKDWSGTDSFIATGLNTSWSQPTNPATSRLFYRLAEGWPQP